MARRKKPEEHENHERWLVSYADFITLLFAFFVVMYAISSVNEGKYRILSSSISDSFRNVPGSPKGQMASITTAPMPISMPFIRPGKSDVGQREKREKARDIAKKINEVLAPLLQEGQVRIIEGAFGFSIEINASALFASGEARLNPEVVPILDAVAAILSSTDFPVTVEGHTDDAPISTAQFPSNWELSGARASSVVRLFITSGVNPRLLTASGFADQRPAADNTTLEGRARNRRVALTFEAPKPSAGGSK